MILVENCWTSCGHQELKNKSCGINLGWNLQKAWVSSWPLAPVSFLCSLFVWMSKSCLVCLVPKFGCQIEKTSVKVCIWSLILVKTLAVLLGFRVAVWKILQQFLSFLLLSIRTRYAILILQTKFHVLIWVNNFWFDEPVCMMKWM